MSKQWIIFVSGILILNAAGCVPLLAGTAGGAGTAVWLSGKLVQDIDYSIDDSLVATEKALEDLDLPIIKEVRHPELVQIRSTSEEDQKIWIDLRRITDSTTKVEVRVGVFSPDREVAEEILRKIETNL